MNIRWSADNAVLDLIQRLAAEHGLVLYDCHGRPGPAATKAVTLRLRLCPADAEASCAIKLVQHRLKAGPHFGEQVAQLPVDRVHIRITDAVAVDLVDDQVVERAHAAEGTA
jgi:hypothetical protein